MSREIRTDAKLKNLPAEKLEDLWLCRYPTDPESKLTYEDILVALPDMVGFTVSRSTLSEFYAWLKQKRRMQRALERSEQAKRELMDQNPDASPEDLERLGQMIFTSETVENGDIKGFVALMKANNTKRKLKLEERRIKMLEAKAQRADNAKEELEKQKTTGGLSKETLAIIEKTLGML
jgi:hypothetical protein